MSDDKKDDILSLIDPALAEETEKAIEAALDKLFEALQIVIRLSLESNIPLFLNGAVNDALANATALQTKYRLMKAISMAIRSVNVRLEGERDDALNRWEAFREEIERLTDDPDPDLPI